jgi:hypothetical protein
LIFGKKQKPRFLLYVFWKRQGAFFSKPRAAALSRRAASLTILLCLMAQLNACGFNQRQVNDVADSLRTSSPEIALATLSKLNAPNRDRGQYLLDLGVLQLLTGDFDSSIASLQSAKGVLENLQAISVSENLAAGTINETLRAYSGTPGERVLLNELLAISYLMQGDLDAARVEVLQADVLMNQLAEANGVKGQLASARFLGGLIFELEGEWDDAMISYRKAAQIMKQRGQVLPKALKDSLLNTARRQQLDEEYLTYVKQFGYEARQLQHHEGELIVFYWDGVVSSIRQRFISVYVPELEQYVSLALPYYPPSNYLPRHLSFNSAGQRYSTEIIEDVETLARRALDARQGEIYAMSLARIVSKQQAVQAAQKESQFAGIVINLAGMFSEIADTRSWNMLPSSIQVARIPIAAGQQSMPIPGISGNANAATDKITIKPGQKVVVLVPEISQQFFSYSNQ